MVENMKSILNKAYKEKYAVPHFNINNLEWTRYILEECQKLNSPVIIGVSEGATKYMGGYNVVANMVKSLVDDLKITIPVVIHLDHGSSIESCKNALKAGFTSVMIDASKYELEENIKITKEVSRMAEEYNASIEAEIGHIGGKEDDTVSESMYANVDDCITLCNSVNLTALAPALGSVHGLYKGEPKLGFERMLEISKKVNLPLVLHGGTGIPDDKIIKAIECGTCKINVNTELQIAWKKGVDEFIHKNESTYDPRKVISGGESYLKQVIDNKVMLFGSKDKA